MALVLPWLFQSIMHLSAEEAAYTRRAFFIGAPLDLVGDDGDGARSACAASTRRRPTKRARGRVLALPFRLAVVTVVCGEAATLVAMAYDQWPARTPLPGRRRARPVHERA